VEPEVIGFAGLDEGIADAGAEDHAEGIPMGPGVIGDGFIETDGHGGGEAGQETDGSRGDDDIEDEGIDGGFAHVDMVERWFAGANASGAVGVREGVNAPSAGSIVGDIDDVKSGTGGGGGEEYRDERKRADDGDEL
jgi:hypothetical protein